MAVGPRQPGNWWNEHVNCAIALWCDEVTFRAVQACAEDRRAHTGTYNLITYNCLTFCVEGAHPFEAWKYWFSLGEPPSNGLRAIQDVPGTDKPLE